MPQLGQYTYPSLKFSRAIEIAKQIASDFKGQVSVSSLATGLEMAESGGAFAGVLAGLRDYNIVDGRKDLSLTQTAEALVYASNPDDSARARADAFFSVELFRRMRDKLDAEVPGEARLRAVVQEITRESLAVVNARLPTIRSIWADGIQSVGMRGKLTEVSSQASPSSPEIAPNITTPIVSAGHFVEFKINESYVRVQRNASDLQLIIQLLTVVRDGLGDYQAPNGTVRKENLEAPVQGLASVEQE